MNKRDSVDDTIYAGNPLSMRVSALKEINDTGLCVPARVSFCVSNKERERERESYYFNTRNPMPMRVSGVDDFISFIYADSKQKKERHLR